VRIIDGVLKKGQTIRMMGTAPNIWSRHRRVHAGPHHVDELAPASSASLPARSREVATPASANITEDKRRRRMRCRASSRRSRWWFCGLFPVDAADFEDLRAAVGKCASTTPPSPMKMTSAALGFGYRCGFLAFCISNHPGAAGARFDLDLIATAPSSSPAAAQ